ncbi:hypothetical protein BDQ12DRAFT_718379 [Crucibulum laeve]|uniref:Uncharacterized protein n=1 Tax=Crucibulum laeve TaxID=68775 RepID=A0A5C3MEM5_9AGAR|nr:hypothetical protein BDQ12DRAFT_718379 [Crucibulum laeve]
MNPEAAFFKDMSAKTSEEIAEMANIPYISAIGSLQYLAIMTHSDIFYLLKLNMLRSHEDCKDIGWSTAGYVTTIGGGAIE